jgi:hypothetical protein
MDTHTPQTQHRRSRSHTTPHTPQQKHHNNNPNRKGPSHRSKSQTQSHSKKPGKKSGIHKSPKNPQVQKQAKSLPKKYPRKSRTPRSQRRPREKMETERNGGSIKKIDYNLIARLLGLNQYQEGDTIALSDGKLSYEKISRRKSVFCYIFWLCIYLGYSSKTTPELGYGVSPTDRRIIGNVFEAQN